ncbi:dynamin family protein [Aminipila luticellarii]|nr:dynamin family protein [Aminipila luticellarii]
MSNSIIDIAKQAEELLSTSEICREERLRVKGLRHKLESQDITVSVIGQFKRGKSTLVNAILEEKLLPVGIIPVTSVVTRIQYGDRSAAVHFDNGVVKPIGFEELSEYINEQENPGNKLCVSSVTLHTPVSFLKNGLTFVDTPGVGSAHKHNSDAAYAFVKESDAVIFMLSVDSPINQIEIDFLSNAKEYAAKFYFAVNKIDYVEAEELTAYLEYCRKLLCSLMEVENIQLFPVSAKYGNGLEELKSRIQTDCKTSVKEILEDSVEMKLKDILQSAMSRLDLYWNALKMPIGRLDSCFEQMKQFLSELKCKSQKIAAELDQEENNDKYFEISNRLELELNQMRKELSASVSELFGMEYHYELTELNITENYRFDNSQDSIENLKNKFLSRTKQLCDELDHTLNLILLYREKNTITVARRIDDLNKLNRQLRKLQSLLH